MYSWGIVAKLRGLRRYQMRSRGFSKFINLTFGPMAYRRKHGEPVKVFTNCLRNCSPDAKKRTSDEEIHDVAHHSIDDKELLCIHHTGEDLWFIVRHDH